VPLSLTHLGLPLQRGGDEDHRHTSSSSVDARRRAPAHRSDGCRPNSVEDLDGSSGGRLDPMEAGWIQLRGHGRGCHGGSKGSWWGSQKRLGPALPMSQPHLTLLDADVAAQGHVPSIARHAGDFQPLGHAHWLLDVMPWHDITLYHDLIL
jgi:hypothetical protein